MMPNADQPLPEWADATCIVCPAQLLGPGRFDVIDRPGPESRYEPAAGYRINTHTGAPTCVHPYRVGLPAGAYASAGEPVPARPTELPAPSRVHLELPADAADLEGWLIAILRVAPPERMASTLAQAEAIASRRFTTAEVVAAIRRVLSHELAHRAG